VLIEQLIRLGRPFLKGGFTPAEILGMVSDVLDPGARNFFTKVILVEVDRTETGQVAVRWERWGVFRKDESETNEVFSPSQKQVVAVPFTIPSGGNPLHAQGRYGVPVYLIYEKNAQAMIHHLDETLKYLKARLERTPGVQLTEQEFHSVGQAVHEVIRKIELPKKEKWLGLLVLALVEPDGYVRYESLAYSPRDGFETVLGTSQIHPRRQLVSDLERILERFWLSKLIEGEEKGRLEGEGSLCSVCGHQGEVVSAYSKAWSWLTTTWPGPLSAFLREDQLVEGVALCPSCYQALTMGGNLFNRMTVAMPMWLTKELFTPVDNPSSKAFRAQPDTIYGGVMALPLLEWEGSEEEQAVYVQSVKSMLEQQDVRPSGEQFYLNMVTGLEMRLPHELMEGEKYRLNLIYYSGDPGRGDIHLRAMIEEVLPSTARMLTEIIDEAFQDSYMLQKQLFGERLGESDSRIYRSLPAMLSKAYGMTRMWSALAAALHRRRLHRQPFVRNAALRMQDLTRKYDEKFGLLKHEVFFFLHFQQFLSAYDALIGEEKGGRDVRSWQELLKLLDERKAKDLNIDNVAELGFAAGYLVRQFSKLYYVHTGGREFLRDRVITFGSRMNPELLYEYGLKRMVEYAYKLKFDDAFYPHQELLGVVLAEYQRRKAEVQRQKDDFMTSFWAGYCLNTTKEKRKGQSDDHDENDGKGGDTV